jgi:membrane-bound metal-dependent hydrolase YbcI (DUF457 family)
MDLFTHVIFAYLVAFAITRGQSPVYIAAAALAGGLPDSDILLTPLAKRFPLLGHHGITHSILGVSCFAVAGAALGPFIVGGATPLYLFLFMEMGGLLHIGLDGFTHYAVPPLAPFSSAQLHGDADRAISFFTLVLSLASFVTLIYERNNVPLQTWLNTAWVLLAIYTGYLAVRGAGRWSAEKAKRAGGFTAVIPSGSPISWTLVEEKEDPARYQMRYAPFRVGKGLLSPERGMSVSKVGGTGPVVSETDAIERAYGPCMAHSRFIAASYRYAVARLKGNAYEVTWFSLEFTFFGKAPGVTAKVDTATGAVTVRSGWVRLDPSGGSLANNL